MDQPFICLARAVSRRVPSHASLGCPCHSRACPQPSLEALSSYFVVSRPPALVGFSPSLSCRSWGRAPRRLAALAPCRPPFGRPSLSGPHPRLSPPPASLLPPHGHRWAFVVLLPSPLVCTFTNVRPTWADVDQSLLELGQPCPTSAKLGPQLTNFSRKWPRFGPAMNIWLKVCRRLPKFGGQHRAMYHPALPILLEFRLNRAPVRRHLFR